jgi:predicted  nucleic acid-binding Zn-ribbon protein
MGPTNISLVKLFHADLALREAQERLDAATKNVRIQDRKVHDLDEKLKLSQTNHKELQAKAGNLDLDLRSRDGHIDKLRTQQQVAKNNKEYQAFLIEINTHKLDRTKVEEDTMKVMEESEAAGRETAELTTMLESERTKLTQLKSQMSDTVAKLQAEIDSLKGPREAAAAALPPKTRDMFNRLSEHHDGEAMSSLLKPDRRKEEYVCSACMMDLVADVYNKLHSRDELVFCPSCRRILYIPADLPPELAVNKKKSTSPLSTSEVPDRPKDPPRAKGKMGILITAAQGESVKNAVDADQKPQDLQVSIDGKVVGIYKGKSAENLERVIRFLMEEVSLTHDVLVTAAPSEPPAAPEAEAPKETSSANV